MRTIVTLLVLSAVLIGCDRRPGPSTQPYSGPARIVTIAPAMTQLLVAMGAGDRIVGVAENDYAAPAGRPVVGNFFDINTEVLLKVQPTHVLMMAGKAGAPPRLRDLSASEGFRLVTYPVPDTVAGIAKILLDDEEAAAGTPAQKATSLGVLLDRVAEARAVRERMLGELESLRKITAGARAQKVLIIIGTSPLMVSGPETVLHDLLSYVSATNAASEVHVKAPVLDREKIQSLGPDVILLTLPQAPPLTSIEDDPRLAELRGLDVPAMRHGRVALISDPLVHLPGSSVTSIAAQMAKAIHPDLAPQIDAASR